MEKRGQIELSFGMIFGIILVIAIISVAVYAIIYFLNFSKCAELKLFYRDIEQKVDDAWRADAVQYEYNGNIPGGLSSICFGNLSLAPDSQSKIEYSFFKKSPRWDKNLFLYPPTKACNKDAYYSLKHIKTDNFFCVPIKNNKFSVKLIKGKFDDFVELSR